LKCEGLEWTIAGQARHLPPVVIPLLGSICHTAKNSLRESEILAVLRKIRLIVSERKRGRRSIKLAGTAQTQFLCGDFFE